MYLFNPQFREELDSHIQTFERMLNACSAFKGKQHSIYGLCFMHFCKLVIKPVSFCHCQAPRIHKDDRLLPPE